jgi:hypothetical protein
LNVLSLIAGVFLIAVALRDVFQGVIVPRAENTTLRVSRYLMRGMWHVWPRIAYRMYPRDATRRENFLGTFAPFHLVTLLATWVVMLVIGWGLVFYGLRGGLHPQDVSFGSALYYAGSSLLTIGYGDIVARSAATRILSLVAAASGLGTVAVVTSFLFSIFGSFQERERFVVTIGARAGVPPSGVGLLIVHAYAGLRGDAAQVFRDGQAWTAMVMESHLAYPILMMFRSSHDYESWVGTLGSLMDAAALVISTLDPETLVNAQSRGQARIMYDLGRHLAADFAEYFGLRRYSSHSGPGIERGEFDMACEQLQEAGFQLIDRDAAWTEFSRLRHAYGPPFNAMARWLEIPPVQWVGDRSALPHEDSHLAAK